MPIHVNWDNDEKTIVRYTFVGKWDWNDFWEAAKASTELSNTVPHQTVDVIGDLSQTHMMPARGLKHLQNVTKLRPANRGVVYFYGANRFVRQLTDALIRMSPNLANDYHMVDTEEDAYNGIEYDREKRKIA